MPRRRILSAGVGGFQIEQIGVEANDDAVLFAGGRDLAGQCIEGAQREVDGDFVDNITSAENQTGRRNQLQSS